MSSLAETWLMLFLLAAGFGLGAGTALALGRLLDEHWLKPLLAPLSAMANLALPTALLLAIPMIWFAPFLFPWAVGASEQGGRGSWYDPGFVYLRSLAQTALWWVLARRLVAGGGRARGGASLAALVATGALAMEDWALSRDPGWTGSVQGLALMTEQLGAALSMAALLALHRGALQVPEQRTGLERALLSLALAVLWLWFTQFLVVYSADIPAEAAWYLRRSEGAWAFLKLGVALPALLGAIALAIVPQWRDWRLALVGALLLLHHMAHLFWTVRPEAQPGAASPLVDLLAVAALGVVALPRWRRP